MNPNSFWWKWWLHLTRGGPGPGPGPGCSCNPFSPELIQPLVLDPLVSLRRLDIETGRSCLHPSFHPLTATVSADGHTYSKDGRTLLHVWIYSWHQVRRPQPQTCPQVQTFLAKDSSHEDNKPKVFWEKKAPKTEKPPQKHLRFLRCRK